MKKSFIIPLALVGLLTASCNFLNVDDYFEDTFSEERIFESQYNIERYFNGAVNQPGADVTQDTIALTVTSVGGTAASSLVIQIIDSLPTAANDVNAVTEDAPAAIVTGNVFSNDAIGADIPAAPVTPAAVR